jgi:hypothetical protein
VRLLGKALHQLAHHAVQALAVGVHQAGGGGQNDEVVGILSIHSIIDFRNPVH